MCAEVFRDSGQAKRAAEFLPRRGVARERRRAPLLVTGARIAIDFAPVLPGGFREGRDVVASRSITIFVGSLRLGQPKSLAFAAERR